MLVNDCRLYHVITARHLYQIDYCTVYFHTTAGLQNGGRVTARCVFLTPSLYKSFNVHVLGKKRLVKILKYCRLPNKKHVNVCKRVSVRDRFHSCKLQILKHAFSMRSGEQGKAIS